MDSLSLNMKNLFIITLFGVLLTLSTTQNSLSQTITPESSRFALTASAGTNGLGGDFTVSISDYLNTRIGYHGFNFTLDGTISDSDPEIDFDGSLSMSSFSLMVDYYPFKKVIGLSVGAFLHSMSVEATAGPNASYVIGNKTFEADELGSLTATIDYSGSIMPYAGLIFSNPVARGIPLKLHIQAGVMYSKQPILEMTGTGMIAPTADNQVNLQEGLDEFQFLPVVNVGLSFRFGKKLTTIQ